MRWIWLAFFLSSGHNGAWQSPEGDRATPAGGDGARPGGGPPTNAEDPEASAAESAASSALAGALTCILSVFFFFLSVAFSSLETGPIDSLIDQLRRGRGGGTTMGHGIGSLRRDAHARSLIIGLIMMKKQRRRPWSRWIWIRRTMRWRRSS